MDSNFTVTNLNYLSDNMVGYGKGLKVKELKMKISIIDLIFICLGFLYGTYELFINPIYRLSYEFTGVLSIVLSIWVSISCIKSRKKETK